MNGETAEYVVTGVEMFRKLLDDAQAGDNVGLLLRGAEKKDISRGQVLAAPKSVTPHAEFKAEIYVLTKDEGGRHTPFMNGYRPQFYFRTTDVTGTIQLPEGVEMVTPGDTVTIHVNLIAPVAMEKPDRPGGNGKAAPLRNPRRWPYRWRWLRNRNHQVRNYHGW